jgi:hypothetical protein
MPLSRGALAAARVGALTLHEHNRAPNEIREVPQTRQQELALLLKALSLFGVQEMLSAIP